MLSSSQLYGFSDLDTFLTTSCHVYERDDKVLTVQLHSDGLHNGFLFAENNIVTVVIDGDSETTMSTPNGSHRSQIVHVMYLTEKYILSASGDGGINLWSFTENDQLEWKNYLNGSRNHLSALQVTSPNHQSGSIVATTKDGYLSVWSRETLMPILSAANGNAPCIDPKGLFSVELFEAANLLVVGGFGRIYLHEDTDSSGYSHITTLGGHKGPVLALASHSFPNRQDDVDASNGNGGSGGGDGGGGDGDASSVRVSDIIISGGEDKALVVWDARMFQEYTRKACAHGSSITSLTVLDTPSCGLSDTPLLASASRDGLIRVWSLPSLTLVHEIGAHQGVVLQVSATLSYGRFNNRPALLSTGGDKQMKLWRMYRILNWERRKHFAFFLAYCGFIRGTIRMSSSSFTPQLEASLSSEEESETTATSIVEATAAEEKEEKRAAERVFSVEFMCKEIISFL
jgi:WD40 repeat protein